MSNLDEINVFSEIISYNVDNKHLRPIEDKYSKGIYGKYFNELKTKVTMSFCLFTLIKCFLLNSNKRRNLKTMEKN
ncbi:hypothetical protein BpHYR1_020481 [Brachionus plicatilis]|uniref:Uncharacterized protein n=1 Tax=Brachionus plicatilis TaxID=10195 RepID=A0A3M7P163_BRAPC|nr:hypothetical protein BpHYR1_020481 [Brachionus plicatilis]